MANEIAGYRFKDPKLLLAGLTHSSYLLEPGESLVEDFERLEFLGDAVVNFVVTADLFDRYPNANEGELTQRRAQVVSRPALAVIGEELGLMERARVTRAAGVKEPRYGFVTRLFESVAGAVYLDGGFEAARDWVRAAVGRRLDAPLRRSPKSELQELTQKRFSVIPEYRVLQSAEPSPKTWYLVEAQVAGRVATESGRTIREAEEAAAAKLFEEFMSE